MLNLTSRTSCAGMLVIDHGLRSSCLLILTLPLDRKTVVSPYFMRPVTVSISLIAFTSSFLVLMVLVLLRVAVPGWSDDVLDVVEFSRRPVLVEVVPAKVYGHCRLALLDCVVEGELGVEAFREADSILYCMSFLVASLSYRTDTAVYLDADTVPLEYDAEQFVRCETLRDWVYHDVLPKRACVHVVYRADVVMFADYFCED